MLRESWSTITLKLPLMWAAEIVQFIVEALFCISSAREASWKDTDEDLLNATRDAELSVITHITYSLPVSLVLPSIWLSVPGH